VLQLYETVLDTQSIGRIKRSLWKEQDHESGPLLESIYFSIFCLEFFPKSKDLNQVGIGRLLGPQEKEESEGNVEEHEYRQHQAIHTVLERCATLRPQIRYVVEVTCVTV
jgi:hypothetical protein